MAVWNSLGVAGYLARKVYRISKFVILRVADMCFKCDGDCDVIVESQR
jgi:hypothetical protein